MQQGDSHPASVNEVRDEIQAISHSRLFAQSKRRIKLLQYLCDMVLLVGFADESSSIAAEQVEAVCEELAAVVPD